MPVHNLGVGGSLTVDWQSRAEPRRSTPMLILSPPDDHLFVAAARDAVENSTTPAQLQSLLRARYPSAVVRQRDLIGERFTHTNNTTAFISGSGFSIGTSRTFTPGGHGFLNLYANDIITAYADNSGSVSVTITRTQ